MLVTQRVWKAVEEQLYSYRADNGKEKGILNRNRIPIIHKMEEGW